MSYRFNARFSCAQFSVNSTFIGMNEPFYLSNTESTVNTNGVVSKTKLGIDGVPILALTAATYYDCTLPRALLPNETATVQFHKTGCCWQNTRELVFYVSGIPLMISDKTAYNTFSGIGIDYISSSVMRVQFGSLCSDNYSVSAISWEQFKNAGYDAWRIRIGQAGMSEVVSDGAIRAWVKFAGSTGAILASSNVLSVVRNSTGNFTINFRRPMPHANYCVTGMSSDSSYGSVMYFLSSTTTSVSVQVCQNNGTSVVDGGTNFVQIVC